MMGAATEKARLPRFSLVLGIESCCEVDDQRRSELRSYIVCLWTWIKRMTRCQEKRCGIAWFAMIMDRMTDDIREEAPWTMMFTDDIVICSESKDRTGRSEAGELEICFGEKRNESQ